MMKKRRHFNFLSEPSSVRSIIRSDYHSSYLLSVTGLLLLSIHLFLCFDFYLYRHSLHCINFLYTHIYINNNTARLMSPEGQQCVSNPDQQEFYSCGLNCSSRNLEGSKAGGLQQSRLGSKVPW